MLLIEVHAVILRKKGQLKFLLTTLAWFDLIFLSTLWFIFLFENSNMTFVSTIKFQGPRREWGGGGGGGGGGGPPPPPPPPPTTFLADFFTLVNQVCVLQNKYITLFYVKYADLLGNAALFWFVHFDSIYFFEGFLVETRPDEAVCR